MSNFPMSADDKLIHEFGGVTWVINYVTDESSTLLWELEKRLDDPKNAIRDVVFLNKVVDTFYAGLVIATGPENLSCSETTMKVELNYTTKLKFFYALMETLPELMGITVEQAKNLLGQQQSQLVIPSGEGKEKVI